jgi:hypothetical protein
MLLADIKLAAQIAIYSSGILLVIAILTGGWKYHHVRTTTEHRAPTYVSIAHQAALADSFSCLVVAVLAQLALTCLQYWQSSCLLIAGQA